jgi:putative FmdB family regulatory protein
MPIYAYKCATCGHRHDALQKISDPLLTVCPACAAPALVKQVTAAGFQLKGSGWYVTDFRDGGGGKDKPVGDKGSDKEVAQSSDKPADVPAAAGSPPATAPSPAAGGSGAEAADVSSTAPSP